MSKYTTQVRFICETYANINKTDEEPLTIEQTIGKSIPYIFDDTWTTADPEHKEELERKILRHYYMREIGLETVPLWKFYLNQTLSEIMPRYNVLYSNLNLVKNKLFNTVDFNEIMKNNAQGTSKSSSTDKNTSNSQSQTDGKIDQTDTTAGNNTSKSKGQGKSDAWQEYADTPQGSLIGLESGRYLTNATHNKGTTTSDTTTEGNTKTETNSHNTSKTTGQSETGSTSESNANTQSDTTSNSLRSVTGKNSGGDYLTQYTKLMQEYQDIDQMIINDLETCFMQLWE